ncbi:hypothetical protein LTR70_002395 [Exophiala xenobiotica]|uniref:Tricarboxylate transport protein n=1 Tax=Lithohypha guttulata TaxID=1690604 RepID=A0ABR0KKS7_9EURO|nr:hypothetical protein LTR24_001392 [Lithohypha guttulata]KAK5325423.1 hypothetical protein LTR70_002395 [Exophiala xenobiotica]
MAPSGTADRRVTPAMSLIAGGTAGGIESFLTYPFEFAKTRVQLRAEKGIPTPRNPFLVVSQVIKNEGVRALYLGCSTLVVGTIAKDAIRFMSFDTIKRAFADPETGSLSPLKSLLAGMSAGVVSSTFAVTPTERIKTALIDDARNTAAAGKSQAERQFRGAYHATKEILRTHGVYGVYRGYVTTTMKQAGTTSVRMGTYNILKELTTKYEVKQNTITSFGNGAIAGIVTTYATQPIDTIKTRAQSAKGAGTVEAFKGVIEDYGIKGLWRGSTMRLGRTVFAGGILFTAYEQIVAILIPIMGRKDVNLQDKGAVQ